MKIFRIIYSVILSVIILLVALFAAMTASPIYRFAEPEPFSGDKIYNPYASADTSLGWSKSNFHTHTKVDKGINECPEYPDVVWADYQKYGYDILSFSNHNALTEFPGDSSRQIWVYEHGYNPLKFHKLVFGSHRVLWYDNLLPILPSQKQFMMDLLSKDSDFLVFNHPDRTFCVNANDMEKVSGYRMIEAYAGKPTSMKHWDEALSAGHYSHCLINDDCHDSGNMKKIAIRCSWLNTPSYGYEDVKKTLLSGCFYTMSIPDFASEGFDKKVEYNHSLPGIECITLNKDTIRMSVSGGTPVYIKAIGGDGKILDSVPSSDRVLYVMRESDPYVRLEASFERGEVIFTNAFCRYSSSDTLLNDFPHPIRWGATIAFNLFLVIIIALCAFCIYLLWRKKNEYKDSKSASKVD